MQPGRMPDTNDRQIAVLADFLDGFVPMRVIGINLRGADRWQAHGRRSDREHRSAVSRSFGEDLLRIPNGLVKAQGKETQRPCAGIVRPYAPVIRDEWPQKDIGLAGIPQCLLSDAAHIAPARRAEQKPTEAGFDATQEERKK